MLAILPHLSITALTALPFIERMVGMGFSGNKILGQLREVSLGIRSQTLYEIVRFYRNIEKGALYLQSLRGDTLPNPAQLPEAITKLRRDYSFKVRYTGIDSNTGEPVDSFVTMTYNTLKTVAQIMNDAFEMISEDSDNYTVEELSVSLWSGVRAGVQGVL